MAFVKLSPMKNDAPTDRQLASMRKLAGLNNGWPYSDGPEHWGWQIAFRGDQLHAVCSDCGQAFFLLSPGPGDSYVVTTDMVKSRVADHCLKVHAAELGDAIRT